MKYGWLSYDKGPWMSFMSSVMPGNVLSRLIITSCSRKTLNYGVIDNLVLAVNKL
jgi:hypothetical protein